MIKVRKSPNMMSTTGRGPGIAAPTPMPVNPASEIGVSMTRSFPNSSTRPDNTLNGVPASATSSPRTHTRESRRISSARASRMASPKLSSRTFDSVSGIHVLIDVRRVRIGRGQGGRDRSVHVGCQLRVDTIEQGLVGEVSFNQRTGEDADGIPLGGPTLFLLLGPVIVAADVPDMMTAEPIRVTQEKRGTLSLTRARDERRCRPVHGPDVLPVDALGRQTECGRPGQNVTGCRLRIVGVLVIEIVPAGLAHRQLPGLGQVHRLVEDPLSERTFAEEAHHNPVRAEILRRERGTGRDSGAPSHDGVCAEVARGRVGDMHRPALALAVPGCLAEELRKHAVRRRSFGEAVSVTTMGACNVVVRSERFANPDRHGLLADVEVREAGHQGASVEIVDPFLEQANGHHLPVHVDQSLDLDAGIDGRPVGQSGHFSTPDMRASTSNNTAKSSSAKPIPRAAVNISFVTAVVGNGTSNCRPISSANTMSFLIMFTLNHTSSGMPRTNGPRYCIIGDPITLCVSTSTAVSRAIPLFSASRTPSENASIWTARLRLMAIFMDSARPFPPTWVTLGPMSSSSGLTRSKVARFPPTITDSLPCSSVTTLPDTGASTMSAPFSRTWAATARLTAGLTVLMSTTTFPGLSPASNPSRPSATASSDLESVTMMKITSAASATARGESLHFIPVSTSHCAFERVRLYPVTRWPLASSLAAIFPPITPRPTYPRLAIFSQIALRMQVSRRRIHMHYAGKSSKNTLTSNPTYENHSQGYTQASLIDHTTGSVHTGLGLNQLAAHGTLSPHIHSYEEGFYVLTGQAVVSINEQTYLLGPGDYGAIKVGTVHAWRCAGPAPVRWLQMAAPQPKPHGKERDTFFSKDATIPTKAQPLDVNDRRGSLLGHFDVNQIPLA